MKFETTTNDYVVIGDRIIVGTPPKHVVRKRKINKLAEKAYYQKHIIYMRFRGYFVAAIKKNKSHFHLKKIVKLYFEKCVAETGGDFKYLRKFFVYLNNKKMLDLLPKSAEPYFDDWQLKEQFYKKDISKVDFNEEKDERFQNIDLGKGRRRILYFGECSLNKENITKLKDVENSIDSIFWNIGRR